PEHHKPIFVWLSLYARRPMEAAALMKKDFIDDVFVVRRAFSGGKLVNRTKTKKMVHLPLLDEFVPYIDYLRMQEWWLQSPYFFVQRDGQYEDKRYTRGILQLLWKKACMKTGENISMYAGTKHSSVTDMLNRGIHKQDIALALGCDIKTVDYYAHAEVATRKAIFLRRSDAVTMRVHQDKR
ncbi:MAG: hypothetical protein LJE65_13945, partial [Desulfobacteraceae bacterium]|nr:hypothetical protein [Desulfobacteraceae bacterium]